MNDALLPLAVRLLRERGIDFAREYLRIQWHLSFEEVETLIRAARRARYPHPMKTRILLDDKV